MMRSLSCVIVVMLMIASGAARAQLVLAPQLPPSPDPRMKADILLVVAHPDDETAIGSLLARLVLDEHRRIAVVYTNRGQGGGNTVGIEQSTAMGLIRETEARRALSELDIFNVWFLDGRDTPGQDAFRSLEELHHGSALEQIVRIIRLTEPEIIVTWLPHFCAGENHGDHQASGIAATEAFDMAGDPTVFPAQTAVPRESRDINNANEGVRAWQPKKIYYFSDASHALSSEAAQGPLFDPAGISASRHVPYVQIASRLSLHHKTQGDVSDVASKAKETEDYAAFTKAIEGFRLIFGKAAVPCTPQGELFEGISERPIPFVRAPGYQPEKETGRDITLELGGIFAFYRDFWKAHAIERVAPLIAPELEIAQGSYMHMPLLLKNETNDTVEVELRPVLAQGWKEAQGSARYRVPPHTVYPVQAFLVAPDAPRADFDHVRWEASVKNTIIGSVSMRVKVSEWTLPQ